MPDPVLPPAPSYQGASTGGTTSTGGVTGTSSGDDIFGLGSLYGKPIFLGTQQVTSAFEGDDAVNAVRRHTTGANATGTTQDLLANVVKLWAQQASDRKANPKAATTYEQLQQALFSAGFYGQTAENKVHFGQWTTQTRDAIKRALFSYEEATKGGTVPQTFTDFLGANQGVGTDDTKPAPVNQLSDPASIRAAAQQSAQAALGRSLDENQLDAFVQHFQKLQTDAENTTSGSASMPELGSQADAFVQAHDTGDYQAHQQTAYTNALVNLLMGSQVRPNIAPVPTATA